MDAFDLRLWKGFLASGGSVNTPAIVDQIVIDSRRIDSANCLFVALPGEANNGHLFVNQAADSGAIFAIVKKDFNPTSPILLPMTLLRVDDPLQALQEIAASYRATKKAKVIAITGSYGKTMVKDLLHACISTKKKTISSPESFNSQIGVALSLLNIHDHHEVAIIEAAISKKNEMDRLKSMIKPDSAIITHIGKKHHTTLGDLGQREQEMIKLVEDVPANSWVLLPNSLSNNPNVTKIKATIYNWGNDSFLPFAKMTSEKHQSKMGYEVIFPCGTRYLGETTSGYHYFLDLLNIALKAAFLENISIEAICRVLNDYQFEPMKTELWQSQIGSTFINDTYCSDPQSVDQSLKQFTNASPNQRKTFIFSGMRGENAHIEADYKRIGQAITKANLNQLILIGDHPFSSLINEVKKSSPTTLISLHPSLDDAIKKLQIEILPDDFVLIKGKTKTPLEKLTKAFNGSIHNNLCTINLAAVQSNLLTIRNKLQLKTRVMVMVKALAYGTSDVRMAKFLNTQGIDILGVSYVDEGVSLKKAGVSQEIFVLNASPHEIAKIIDYDLSIGVSDAEFILELGKNAEKQQKKVKVHLHVNTGMNRFGCLPEDALNLSKLISNSPFLILDGIMTHFAASDDKREDEFTLVQAACFDQVIQEIQTAGITIPWHHACNSSAVIRFQFPQYNMVRIGLAIYGLYASKESELSLELKLAVSLTSSVVGINLCKAGDTVSYGRSYKIDQNRKIAVLPIGYFDGMHRNYSGKGYVVIGGKKAPMVGKICMDYMMVDVSDIPDVKIGDRVLVFGEDEYGNYLSPEEFATSGDSIVYELITCLGPRIQRVFIFEEALSFR